MSGKISDNLGRSSGLVKAAGGGGKMGQVQYDQTTAPETTTSTSAVVIPNLSVAITPSATSSLVLFSVQLTGGITNGEHGTFQMFRDTTAIAMGDADGARSRANFGFRNPTSDFNYSALPWHMQWVDNPSTTSEVAYTVKWFLSGGTLYLNRSLDNTDHVNYHRTVSSMTAMEILA